MPRFLFWSDLHNEFGAFRLPDPTVLAGPVDAVLLGGDTDTRLRHLDFAASVAAHFACPAVMVAGNHEFYGRELEEVLAAEDRFRAAPRGAGREVHILRGEAVEIAGVRIAGATLWTDFALYPGSALQTRGVAGGRMNDFRIIRNGTENRPLTPDDSAAIHQREKTALFAELARPHPGPTVVLTHHMPLREAIHPKYGSDPLNAAFASDLLAETLALDFHTWIYGHSHENYEIDADPATGRWYQFDPQTPAPTAACAEAADGPLRRFRSNPRGYPFETTRFDPLRVLEL